MSVAGALQTDQRIPGVREHPPRAATRIDKPQQQQRDGSCVTDCDGRFHRQRRLMDGRYGSKKELSAGGIGSWQVGVVDEPRLGRVQLAIRWIGRYDYVWVITKPLDSSVPDVPIHVSREGRPHQQKRYSP